MVTLKISHRARLPAFLQGHLTKGAAVLGTAVLAGMAGFATGRTGSLLDDLFAGSPLEATVVPAQAGTASHPYAPYWVFPADPTFDPETIDLSEWYDHPERWSRGQAIAGSPQLVRLALRGTAETPVIIHDIVIHVRQRAAPTGGWFLADAECGGAQVRIAMVDLDAVPPRTVFRELFDGVTETLALVVTDSDVEIIEIQAHTSQSFIEWEAEIIYTGPDGLGSLTVNDEGRPFRVTSEVGSKAYRPDRYENAVRRDPEWDQGILAC